MQTPLLYTTASPGFGDFASFQPPPSNTTNTNTFGGFQQHQQQQQQPLQQQQQQPLLPAVSQAQLGSFDADFGVFQSTSTTSQQVARIVEIFIIAH